MNVNPTAPVPNVAGIGPVVPVALLFLMHIVIAEYTVGAITLSTAMEFAAARTGSERALRYARAAGNSYYLLFSFGATLAVFAVVTVTGLYAKEFGDIVNQFLPTIGIAFGLFFVITPLLAWHHLTAQTMAPRRHAWLALALTIAQSAFVITITSIDAYLMTPTSSTGLASFATASYLPLIVHRLIGNVSWAALFLAAFAAWKHHRGKDPDEREFQQWAAHINLRIGLWLGLLMPVGGFLLAFDLSQSQPVYFGNLTGPITGGLMILQETLVAVMLIGGNLALMRERGRGDLLGVCATGIVIVGMFFAAMPATVIGSEIVALRYMGLGLAVVATAAHLWLSRRAPALNPRSVGRWSLAAAGVGAIAVTLLMGFIKEDARGTYAVYGVLQQSDARGSYIQPPGTYP